MREEGKERELGLLFNIKAMPFKKNKIIKRNKNKDMPVLVLAHTIIIHIIEKWNDRGSKLS